MNLAGALLLNEKLRRKSTIDTTNIIQEWRERRYGESCVDAVKIAVENGA